MSHHHFEELEVWKRSCRLSVEVLQLVDGMTLWALRDQIARSCISVPSNIVEGAERETDKEFRRFLNIAKGSAGELRTQLFIGTKAGYFDPEITKKLTTEAKEISNMIQGLSKTLKIPE
ncbi:four helix bundle protein [Roseibacillus persicicus]|uniref:four helix bundle protein n=1 Tax=Roseibacillus persicicus TaxID=454148 RepID=UPI00280E5FA6|nr:four helix bundle protein [Roseibacillus persicicus]MDQ8190748.1 four helix bundle protein [Roseibacillus persicicus]